MKIAIIGAGASGLVCAVETMQLAKESDKLVEVTVFEKNERVGKKLLSTGNGRCNMTNLSCCADDYFNSRDFVSFALSKFTPQSNIEFFNSLGLYVHTDSVGRVYPLSNQAAGVLDVLRFACERLKVKFRCSESVNKIICKNNVFIINDNLKFDKVVVASGGCAAVRDYNGYNLLSSLGHEITDISPSLVKLTTAQNETKQLRGIRAGVNLTLLINEKVIAHEHGELLFGDNVLSGIASMQLSPYISRHFRNEKTNPVVVVDFIPDFDFELLVKTLKRIAAQRYSNSSENLLSGFMPKKIGIVILKKAGVDLAKPMKFIKVKQLKNIAALCKEYAFEIDGTKGFSEAQVTAGGASTDMFNPETLESKKVSGLYCCGEVLDVDGPCGGYNLQWAWSSGRLCAESIITEGNP